MLKPPTVRNVQGEHGQIALFMVLGLMAVFLFFALGVDAGAWYFDHRRAQNQAEAAALAAVQELGPRGDTGLAVMAANDWLEKNGAARCGPECMEFSDADGDGKDDRVRVVVRRPSSGFFSKLVGIDSVSVSAAATAMIGRVSAANVMPWGVVPPDPTCTEGETCQDAQGIDCGPFRTCPYGLRMDLLLAFKAGDTVTPGNFGAISACDVGQTNYRDCIEGELVSGFWRVGTTQVAVRTAPGSGGGNTNTALAERYPEGAACDVTISRPDPVTGRDPLGKAEAERIYQIESGCEDRQVIVPIIDHFPQGSSDSIMVLSIAVFAVASWDRQSPWGTSTADTVAACGSSSQATPGFECGMVWGYLLEGARPPDELLQKIDPNSNDPLAPLLIALVD